MDRDMDKRVDCAVAGDAAALDSLVRSVQDRVFGLAVKMLYHRADAEDAAQEILIRIITGLAGFRRDCAFETWAMRIAANHLLTRRQRSLKEAFTFERCESMIIREIPDPASLDRCEAELGLAIRDMRILCVQGLFQCLAPASRLAYILGETMSVTSGEGAMILRITSAAFRQRVSRARMKIRGFLRANCELFDTANPCKCPVQALSAIDQGLIDAHSRQEEQEEPGTRPGPLQTAARLRALDTLAREAALLRSHPDYTAPRAFACRIRSMLDTGRFDTLNLRPGTGRPLAGTGPYLSGETDEDCFLRTGLPSMPDI